MIKKNIIWNFVGSGLPLIAAILCIPYLIRHLGNEAFGILTLVWALVGYFSLFDLGVGRALTYQMSQLQKSQLEIKSSTFVAGILIALLAGLFGAAVVLIFAPNLVSLLKISSSYRNDALLTFQVCAIGIMPTTVTSGLRGALEGIDNFAASNISKIFIGISMFVMPVIAIKLHHSQIWEMTMHIVILRAIICLMLIVKLKAFFIKFTLATVTARVKSLMNYSIWVWVSGVIGPLMVYGDRFFVSAYVGAALLPIYAIPQEGLQRLLIIPTAICGALLPKLSALKPSELTATYKHYISKVTNYMFYICLISALSIYPILTVWISPEFAQQSFAIALVLCAGIFINSVSLVPSTLIQARGHTKFIALSHTVELIIYIFLVWWLTQQYGLLGAAFAWLLRQVIDLTILKFAVKYFLKNTHLETKLYEH